MASSWGNSWGIAWGNSWGSVTSATSGSSPARGIPKNIIEYLVYRNRVQNAQMLEASISYQTEETKPIVKEIQEEFDDHLETISLIPKYEIEMLKNNIDAFIQSIDFKISLIQQKFEKRNIDINLIVALLASDLDELEIALILANI